MAVNTPLVSTLRPGDVEVSIGRVEAAEGDAMWSFVGKKREPRWLWPALAHGTGKILAYVVGRRQDEMFLQLKALLEPFGITRFFTDHWGAYARHLAPETHVAGKRVAD
jgi:insertion element IS1 protein InsB